MIITRLFIATLFIFPITGVGFIVAQTPVAATATDDRSKGFDLYARGQFNDAIKTFNSYLASHDKDAEAWDMLGRSYDRLNMTSEARKAFSTAVKADRNYVQAYVNLGLLDIYDGKFEIALSEAQNALKINPKLSSAHYVAALSLLQQSKVQKAFDEATLGIQSEPVYRANYLLACRILIGKYSEGDPSSYTLSYSPSVTMRTKHQEDLNLALVYLDKYLKFAMSPSERQDLEAQLEVFKGNPRNLPGVVETTAPNLTRAVIISKPDPTIGHGIAGTGTVILRVVLAADGSVTNIMVAQGLPNGMSQAAVIAAKKIKFTPAMMDGHPVSQYEQIDYPFK